MPNFHVIRGAAMASATVEAACCEIIDGALVFYASTPISGRMAFMCRAFAKGEWHSVEAAQSPGIADDQFSAATRAMSD